MRLPCEGTEYDLGERFGDDAFAIDGDRATDIRGMLGRAEGTHVFSGIYCFSPELLDLIPPGKISVIPAFLTLAEQGRLGAVVLDEGDWRDLGDPAAYLAAHRELKLGPAIHPGAHIHPEAVVEASVIGPDFRERYLSEPGKEGIFEARAIVFDGSDDYHHRINDPALNIDERCILVIRGAGPIGWPGSAEVVNMQPPDHLLKKGIMSLPTLGDGRQSGTADSPSILNASPESAVGGGLSWLRTGDVIRIDINTGRYTGDRRLEDTITRINLEAVEEIVHQIRLRDLGGIIVIDFIDMEERRNQQKVFVALEQALRKDR